MNEFPGYANIQDDVAEFDDADETASLHRRQFLALSAAIGASTFAGCRRPDLEILPFSSIPDDQIGHTMPGRPTFYATTLPRPGGSLPVLVESHDGRPTKIEGNPQHPASGGATDPNLIPLPGHMSLGLADLLNDRPKQHTSRCGATDVHAQAAIYDLYSPDRLKIAGPLHRGQPKTWAEFEAALPSLIPADGEGFYVLADKVPSPAVRLVREQLKAKFPGMQWHAYEPLDDTNALEGAKMVFGKPLRVHYNFADVEGILAVDCDFLGTGPDAVRYSREFMSERAKKRLYAIESRFTMTGTMADHRLPLAANRIGDFLEQEETIPPIRFLSEGIPPEWMRWRSTGDLLLVVVGLEQPAWVHAMAYVNHASLHNYGDGNPYVFSEPPPEALDKPLAAFVTDINAGKVKTLLILGGNPAFTAPVDLNFREALAKIPHTIRLGLFHDHTSEACEWHLPQAHSLESWGDTETSDGTHCCIQPLIAPLRGGRSVLELLGKILGAKETPYDWVRKSFEKRFNLGSFDQFKQLGFLPNSARHVTQPDIDKEALDEILKPFLFNSTIPTPASLEVTFHPDYKLLDGRYAMNPWLQELPDPITKLTWDNAALLSPKTAAEFGVSTGDMIELTVNGRTLEIPAFVLPGQADFSIALHYGQFGEMRITHVPKDCGGFNVFAVRDSKNPHIATGCTLRKTGQRYDLAVTQEHGEIPEGRDIIRELFSHDMEHLQTSVPRTSKGNLPVSEINDPITETQLKRQFQGPYGNPEFRGTPGSPAKQERFPLELARPELLDSQYQWGMVIDLNSCTGCSACVIACQAENNIPVVGKSEIKRNREMHWIRIDRYFLDAKSDSPRIAHQPVACVHCEAAPCEQVCPVNAAVHSPEGLNLQVYNRCIGTRYCANACPYKVRRFNWFDFNKRSLDELRVPTPFAENGMSFRDAGIPESLRMQKNPDVTVRMRGVMEKCTYCVQRLEAAKTAAKIAATQVAQGRRSIPVDETFHPANGSEYRKPKDATTAGYDLDSQGRVIVPDGFVVTACQQVCPTGAIVFGNTRDPNSKVSAAKKRAGEYLLLGELNTKPRTSYLPRVRNVNPDLG